MKAKLAFYILCFCLFIGGTALLGVYLYAVSTSLPHGLRISGWKPQAADLDAFEREWEGRLEKLEWMQVQLVPSDSRLTPAASRLRDLGMNVDDKKKSGSSWKACAPGLGQIEPKRAGC